MQEVDENKMILNAYRGVLRSIKTSRTREETKSIRKAFNMAVEAHKDMRRGSPTIEPLFSFEQKASFTT